jgi:hypothetical protein
MPGFVVERHGYANAGDMMKDVITDMLANGFTQVLDGGVTAFNKASVTYPLRVCMEASGDVDPLNATAVTVKQPWRVMIDVLQGTSGGAAPESVFMYAATPLQLGGRNPSPERNANGDTTVDIIGNVGNSLTDELVTFTAATGAVVTKVPSGSDYPLRMFISRNQRVGTAGAGYPLSYRLVITNRGFWLGTWEEANTAETAAGFSWVLVQRPVDRTTGAVLTTGKAPVFCVCSTGGAINQFVVRESDILRPGKRRSAIVNEIDSEAIINGQPQVALSEDGKYIVTFPSRLNTSRYRYPHELDMIGITSADVVSQFSDVPLTVYGEAQPRSYKALHSNSTANTGMRILVLQQGGGIS